MSKARFSRRTILKISAILLLIVLLVSSGLLILKIWENRQGGFDGSDPGKPDTSIKYNGKNYVYNDKLETVLIIGLDKFGNSIENNAYNNDQQADFLVLLIIDNSNSSYTALQINRDTMTDVNILGVAGEKIDSVTKQIALSHTYGNGKEVSCRNTADAVSGLLNNIMIDHYVSLTMDSVPLVNDAVGGVELKVLDDFTGIDDTLVKDQTVTLLGEHALTYVRARQGMDDATNQNRMERQRQYLNALYDKFCERSKTDENFVVDLSLDLSDHMVSDCSVNKLQTLFEKLSDYELSEIRTLEGTVKNGTEFVEFYPEEEYLTQTVVEFFYKEN